jgi:hypothetical protein
MMNKSLAKTRIVTLGLNVNIRLKALQPVSLIFRFSITALSAGNNCTGNVELIYATVPVDSISRGFATAWLHFRLL